MRNDALDEINKRGGGCTGNAGGVKTDSGLWRGLIDTRVEI